MKAKEIYNRLMLAFELTPKSLEKKADLGNKTVASAIERDGNISQKTIDKILNAFPNINSTWILTGNGNMFIGDSAQGLELKVNTAILDSTPNSVFDEHGKLLKQILAGQQKLEEKLNDFYTKYHDQKTEMQKISSNYVSLNKQIAGLSETYQLLLNEVLPIGDEESASVQKSDKQRRGALKDNPQRDIG